MQYSGIHRHSQYKVLHTLIATRMQPHPASLKKSTPHISHPEKDDTTPTQQHNHSCLHTTYNKEARLRSLDCGPCSPVSCLVVRF